MARAPRPRTVRRALEPLLGPERCAALQAALIVPGRASGRPTVAPGAVHVGYEPVDAEAEMRALLGPEVSLFPQHGAGISGPAGPGHRAPVHPRPRAGADHLARPAAAGALTTPRARSPTSPTGPTWRSGPQFDGGFYMVGIRRVRWPHCSRCPRSVWRSPDAMSAAIVAAREAELEVGLLRAERGLRRPEDVRAALADPLTDPEIRAILELAFRSALRQRTGEWCNRQHASLWNSSSQFKSGLPNSSALARPPALLRRGTLAHSPDHRRSFGTLHWRYTTWGGSASRPTSHVSGVALGHRHGDAPGTPSRSPRRRSR